MVFSVDYLLKSIKYLLTRRSLADMLPIIQDMKDPLKEILETMSVYWRLREDVGEESILVDFCSGKRALTAVFTLLNLRSIVKAVAVDVEEPHPYLKNYRDLHYVRKSLFSKDIVDALKKHLDDKPVYGVGIHCCGELSIKAIDLAAELNIGKLYLMPCCLPRKRIEGMETYRDWVEYLARYGEGKGFTAESIEEIKWLLTDKNILITLASKPRVPQ